MKLPLLPTFNYERDILVLPASGGSTVDIVAHSMGGLIVRRYAEQYGVARIDKAVYLGTPHAGSPSAFGPLAFNNALNHFLNYRCVDNTTLAAIARTFPSSFELLPRVPFVFSTPLDRFFSLDETYRQPPTGFGFLANSQWVDTANQFHQSIAVDLNMPQYLVVGTGLPTTSQFVLESATSSTRRRWCVQSGNGDNTVPTTSATAIGATATFYVDQAAHVNLPNLPVVQRLILDILTGNLTSLPDGVSRTETPLGNTADWCTGSPISLSISDATMAQDGIGPDGETRTDIAGSDFVVFEDNQSGFLKLNQTYQFTLTGTDIGLFSLTIRQKDSTGATIGTTQFTDVPIGAYSVGTLRIVLDDFSPLLALDVNGDGASKVLITANQPVSPASSISILESIVQGLDLNKGSANSLLAKLDAAMEMVQRGQTDAASGPLGAFENEVDGQAGKAIKTKDAAGLRAIVGAILTGLH